MLASGTFSQQGNVWLMGYSSKAVIQMLLLLTCLDVFILYLSFQILEALVLLHFISSFSAAAHREPQNPFPARGYFGYS